MAEKQSLYELLGVPPDAPAEDIRRACEAHCGELVRAGDSEENRHRIVFLRQAADVLCDQRRRAGYDQQRRAGPAVEAHAAPVSASPWPFRVAVVAVMAGIAVFANGQRRPGAGPGPTVEPVPAPAVARTAAPAPVPAAATVAAGANAEAPLPGIEDIAARIDAGTGNPKAGAPAPAATPAAAPLSRQINVPGAYAHIIDRIGGSTFLIIGSKGLGTGVAIDSDKVLTNCHVIAPNVLKGPIHAVNAVTRKATPVTQAAMLVTEDACIVVAPGLDATPIATGNSGELQRGTPIYNLGYAQGRLTASEGRMLGLLQRPRQTYLATNNYCDHGVSGGPLVDAQGRLVGLTSGGSREHGICLSLTVETARLVLAQMPFAIDAFPPNYLTNLHRNW